MMRVLVLAVVGMLLLAGCSKEPKDSPASALDVPQATVDAGSGKGALAGVVVDQAIRPIAGANVSAEGLFHLTTDGEGRFVVEDLDPGIYMVHVTADGFLPMQTGTEVKVGDSTPVRLMLTRDDRPQPRHQTYHFNGHSNLWVGQKVIEDNAPDTTDCTCEFEIAPEGIVRTFVVEANGTYTLENPNPNQNLVLAKGTVAWTLTSTEAVKASGQRNFPIWSHVQGDHFANSTAPYTIRLTGANWPAGEINYDLYVTVFYVDPAHDQWSLLAGDE